MTDKIAEKIATAMEHASWILPLALIVAIAVAFGMALAGNQWALHGWGY